MAFLVTSRPAHITPTLQRLRPQKVSQTKCNRSVLAQAQLSRRGFCSLAPAYGSLILAAPPALAFERAPEGFLLHRDILDGYSFAYPDSWSVVTTSGNDVFYKNPRVADENVFVAISSPSSSKYASVADLGTPEAAAKKLETQFLTEYMSTRIGVRREVSVLSAESRQGVPLALRPYIINACIKLPAHNLRAECWSLLVCVQLSYFK